MPDPPNPHFHEQAAHAFLRCLDKRIEGKRAALGGCTESHHVLLKTELAEAEVIRLQLERLLGAPSGARHVYIVMADCGVGEFLWYRRSISPKGYRACMGSLMDSEDASGRISAGLWEELRQWASWFLRWAHESGFGLGPRTTGMDWDRFNAEGLRLARKLRSECSAEIEVEYRRAFEDPYDGPDRTTEVPFADSARQGTEDA